MKKQILLSLAAIGAAAVLCGFDSAETAESILEKASENSATFESTSAGMALNCDIALNIGDDTTTSTIQILAGGDYAVDVTLDPFAMWMTGSFSLSTFGQNETVKLEMYGVTNDAGALETYTYTEDSSSDEEGAGTWLYSETSDFNFNELVELSSSMDFSSVADWLTFEVAPEAADYEGTECYLLTCVLDSSDFETLFQKSIDLIAEITGEELSEEDKAEISEISSYLALLEGLKVKIEYYVDTTNYVLTAMHIDLNDSDLSVLNTYASVLLASEVGEDTATTIEIVFNDVSMDYSFSYGDVDTITVPEDVIAAATAIDPDEFLNEIETEIIGLEG